MSKTVYIRGLPRSGTNLLEYVLKENFDVNIKSASKHGIIPVPDEPEIRLAFITKHPVDWILSLYAYGVERPDIYVSNYKWPEFVKRPLVMITGPRGMWFRSPVDVWNCYHNHYRTWKNAVHIMHRSFTVNTLAMLQKLWALKVKQSPLIWPPYSMNTNATPTGQVYKPRKRQGMWNDGLIKWVMDRVNMELFRKLGYHKQDRP